MSRYDPKFDLKINVGHYDLYFMVHWFCLISWRLWYINTILWDYESVWPEVWPQNKCRSLWPIFHGPVILPYILKTIWYKNTILWDYELVWPDVWPKINVGHCDLYFMAQWFCLKSWRLFDIWPPYFGIMIQYAPMFDLKINVGHCDLYFMVQWFCLISWRLFDIWNHTLGLSQYDPMFDLKMNVGHCDLYFMVKCFALYLEDYLMCEHHYLGLWVCMT